MASGLLSSFPTKEKKLKCFSPFRLYIVCTYIYAWEHPISCLIPSQLLINYSKKEKLLLCSRSIDPIDRPGLIVWILKWHQPCKYHASVRVDLPPVFCSGGGRCKCGSERSTLQMTSILPWFSDSQPVMYVVICIYSTRWWAARTLTRLRFGLFYGGTIFGKGK
jgi:hypothetical protein